MSSKLRLLLLGLASWTLLMGSECPIPDDDDDDDITSSDDDDATGPDDDDAADDDDAVPVGSTTIEGEVIGLDRESGAVLSSSDYSGRAGGLILYVLPDGGDLSVVFGKMTMSAPGPYSVTIPNYAGPVDVVAVVDEDKNFVIDSSDVLREHAFNPLAAQGNDTTISGINVYVDIARPGNGGGGDDDDDDNGGDCSSTAINGDVIITGYPDGAVVVTSNSADLSDGPREMATLPGAQAWSMSECNSYGTTSVLGALDADDNGFWEPSDPWGDAPANPYVLGLGTINGVTVGIPSLDPIDPPSPVSYVTITGTVSYDSFLTGNIVVAATHVNTAGQLFSEQTIAAPGPFELVVPGGSSDVLVWAVLDDDSNGQFDVLNDPFDSQGPMNVGIGASGIDLTLGDTVIENGTISGTVDFDGAYAATDCQTVALFDVEPAGPSAQPIDSTGNVLDPQYPMSFEFADVVPGQYWIAGYLDVGCDNITGPSAQDPAGRLEWPVQLASGGAVTGLFILMEE